MGYREFNNLFGNFTDIFSSVSCLLGKGGFGKVFKVKNKVTQRMMALKTMENLEKEQIKQNISEYEIYESIQREMFHNNVIRMEDLFIFQSTDRDLNDKPNIFLAMVMELGEESLEQNLKRRIKSDPGLALY